VFDILLIDDNNSFFNTLSLEIKRNKLDVHLVWEKEYSETDKKYYLYIVDKINGAPKATQVIERIKEKDPEANIYVVSKNGDYNVLKTLFNLEVEGFLDKNNLDVSQLIKYIDKQIKESYKLKKLSEKATELNSVFTSQPA